MALQLGAIRHALLEAGATPEKAGEGRLAGIDTKLTLLTWMLGFNLAVALGVLWRLLAH